MPVRRILREAADQGDKPVGGPNWNGIRVDPSTDTLVFGTSTSGTTEKTAVDTSSTQTLTAKTLTSPTITTPTVTGGTITGATLNSGIDQDFAVLAASQTYTSSTVLTNLTGLTWTLVAGATYVFEVNLPTTMTTNGGAAIAFHYTNSLTLTSIQVTAEASTASAFALSQSTTTTDQTAFFNSKAAAYVLVNLTGSMVVNAGGTLSIQAAQNTSNTDTTTIAAGGWAMFTRVA